MKTQGLIGALALLVFSLGCDKAAPAPAGAASGQAGSVGSTGARVQAASAAPVLAAPPAPVAAPDVIAKQYLELGAKGDLSKIKDLVDPACAGTKVGEVDAVRMMGARMTLTETLTTVESYDATTAKVKYTVKGSIDAKDARTETDLLGKKVEIRASGLTMSGVTQTGTLSLKKLGERWVVACP